MATFFLVVLPFLIWRWIVFGRNVPQTVLAVLKGVTEVGEGVVAGGVWVYVCVCVPV